MIKTRLLLFLALLFWYDLSGQYHAGISGSNYQALQNAVVNPSSLSNSKKSFDIQLIGGHLGFQNNYIFIPKADNRFGNKINLAANAFQLEFPGFFDEDYIFDDRITPSPKYGNLNLRISGPGFMYSWGNSKIALSFSSRLVISGKNIPYDVAKFAYERRHYPSLHQTRHDHNGSISLATASWMEIGITYSAIKDLNRNFQFAAGFGIRRLFGLHGIVMQSNNLSYTMINSDSLHVYRLKGSLGIALPIDYDNNRFLDPANAVQGKGFAVDAGITVIKTASNSRYKLTAPAGAYTDYEYRIGISLLDIGLIHYNGNSGMMHFDGVSGLWPGLDSLKTNSVNKLKEEIRSVFSESGNISETNAFNLWLPSALGLKFDYYIGRNLYVNALWIQNLSINDIQLAQPSVISITPRFESSFFEMALPLSLRHYHEVHLGLVLRAGILTIGTNRIGGFLGFNDFEGFDFFFSVSAGLCKLRYQRNYNRFGNCYPFF